MDIIEQAKAYLAQNAAESGADVLIRELIAEVESLRGAAMPEPHHEGETVVLDRLQAALKTR